MSNLLSVPVVMMVAKVLPSKLPEGVSTFASASIPSRVDPREGERFHPVCETVHVCQPYLVHSLVTTFILHDLVTIA
jgi:hypothetical protein